jgi:hypothetical protein
MNQVMQTEEPISTADLIAKPVTDAEAARPLLAPEFVTNLRNHWDLIQTSFVDEPRESVKQADELVASVIKRLTESFASERDNLERQWGRGEQVNTEDLRVALRKYRTFFQKLLSV